MALLHPHIPMPWPIVIAFVVVLTIVGYIMVLFAIHGTLALIGDIRRRKRP